MAAVDFFFNFVGVKPQLFSFYQRFLGAQVAGYIWEFPQSGKQSPVGAFSDGISVAASQNFWRSMTILLLVRIIPVTDILRKKESLDT